MQVAGRNQVSGAVAIPHGDRDGVVPLGQAGDGVPEAQVDPGLAADVRAQQVLHDGLGDLLAGLGEPLVPLRGQPERAVEVRDAAPGQRFAERDPLRPGDRQRRGRAQRVREAPAAQVLHGPHAGGLGPGPAVRDVDPRFDDHAGHAAAGQFRGGGQPRRAAARHQDRRAGRARRPSSFPWAGRAVERSLDSGRHLAPIPGSAAWKRARAYRRAARSPAWPSGSGSASSAEPVMIASSASALASPGPGAQPFADPLPPWSLVPSLSRLLPAPPRPDHATGCGFGWAEARVVRRAALKASVGWARSGLGEERARGTARKPMVSLIVRTVRIGSDSSVATFRGLGAAVRGGRAGLAGSGHGVTGLPRRRNGGAGAGADGGESGPWR